MVIVNVVAKEIEYYTVDGFFFENRPVFGIDKIR
jgi:hypothetical protein